MSQVPGDPSDFGHAAAGKNSAVSPVRVYLPGNDHFCNLLSLGGGRRNGVARAQLGRRAAGAGQVGRLAASHEGRVAATGSGAAAAPSSPALPTETASCAVGFSDRRTPGGSCVNRAIHRFDRRAVAV